MSDKIRPVDFKTAKARLGSKDRVKLDRNTYLERVDDKTIVVILHQTAIVTYTPTYTELDSGGWHTMTTRGRIEDYIPMALATHPRSWSLYPLVDVPCYCMSDSVRTTDAVVVDGEWQPGMAFHWTGMYQRADGTRTSDRMEGDKPVYIYRPCEHCKGTGTRKGHDWESGGFVYFDGIRIKPDGSKLMAKQPNKSKFFEPVVTVSGWTGRRMTGPGARSYR